MTDLERPMKITEIVWSVLRLYQRYAVPLVMLALPIVFTYDAVLFIINGLSTVGKGHQSAVLYSPYNGVGISMLAPVISALYVYAASPMGERIRLRISPVARAGLRVLPVVLVSEFVAALGITAGFLFLFVPGVVLLLRWSAVGPVAAFEQTGWLGALRRSGQLVAGNYGHVLGLIIAVVVLSAVPATIGAGAISAVESSSVAVVTLAVVIETVIATFGALALTMLYFDLRARRDGFAETQSTNARLA
jgi:hypothetical protein